MNDNLSVFLSIFSESFENNIFSKLTISLIKKINTENLKNRENIINTNNIIKNINTEKNVYFESIEYKSIVIKPVVSNLGNKLSFVFKYQTKDITKNYSLEEGIFQLKLLIGNCFLHADLYLISNSYHLMFDKNGKSRLLQKQLATIRNVELQHDKQKKRLIEEGDLLFLKLLGIFTEEGKLKNDKRDKFKQINKYLEFFAQSLKESSIENDFRIADMGSGKGYLTFAMYDFIFRILRKNVSVIGVEFRPEMVNLCNDFAKKANFLNLNFIQGTIEISEIGSPNVLIALHACDIATDEAIFRGIKLGAEVIMISPCCHKQIRKQLNPVGTNKSFSKFGIIEERQAEIVTDIIRALILESYGYHTKIFEFISSEHTPKNLMITAVKKNFSESTFLAKIQEVKSLKESFGIQVHYLEKLLNIL